jgi:hypothetical protein
VSNDIVFLVGAVFGTLVTLGWLMLTGGLA